MAALRKLEKTAVESGSILCFGIDPKAGMEDIVGHYSAITDVLLGENLISAIKPNYAYFAALGFDGLHALKRIIDRYKGKTFVILDAKRGDIGKSSEAYAQEAYGFWGADAVTVAPYMGGDSIAPFIRADRIAYVLGRTSNPGAKDFEELKVGKERVYEKVCVKAAKMGAGLVVGATSDALPGIVKLVGKDVPMLIPGIGAQGGGFDVLKALRRNPFIHRVNSSSSIAFAHEKKGENPESAAKKEAEFLNREIGKRVF
ncbi:MAG: orotidine-5'-phosphate decarboxylase [Candidatus ainarchaeum sp.]|nr:orotidine-5'-phosphate decarboxylase [Candidatus ainarchaeum sp.]